MAHDETSLDSIFCGAIGIASGEERAAFIAQACGSDDELRRRVERLIDAHFQAGNVLQSPSASATRAVGSAPATEDAGADIGPYRLLQAIGEGGMGTVFMAEQTRPLRRTVALKLIKAGMDSRQVLARFAAERQALALMDHPNIAKVLDAGTTDSRRPYFVMELVKGIPITRFCDKGRLTLRERLELFIPVCQAVQHAHQKGIIHRDLKPSNVLIALYDGQPVPKVIDFGVAKATGQRLTDQTLFTDFGAVVGTLEYMSPEQAELNQLDIDTRSDIYSLGVLLYELLTGSTPLDRKRIKESALLEVLRVIREEESPRPSLRLSTTEELPSIAACRHVEPQKLRGLVRGELDWIVMKALEKDRNRRYETANGLAADLRRYLEDEPVQACPPSAGYRMRRLIRRHKLAISTVLLVAAALVFGIVVSTWQAMRARDAERLAENRLGAEKSARGQAEAARAEEGKQRGLAERRRAESEESRRSLESTLADMYTAQGLMAAERDQPAQAVLWFASAPRVAPSDARRSRFNTTRARAWSRTIAQPVAALHFATDLPSHKDGDPRRLYAPRLQNLAFHPREPHLLAVNSSFECIFWDIMRDEAIPLPGELATATSAAWSPDGKRLAIGRKSGEVEVLEYARWNRVARIAHRGTIRAVAFNKDGRYLAFASEIVRVWDCQESRFATPELVHPQPVELLTFNSRSDRIVTTCRDSSARVFAIGPNGGRDQPLFDPVPHHYYSKAAQGQLYAPVYADHDRALITTDLKPERAERLLWRDAETGRVIRVLQEGMDLCVGSEQRIFLAGLIPYSLLVDAVSGLESGSKLEHDHAVLAASFSADGRRLLTGGMDGITRLWSVPDGKLLDQRGLHENVTNVALSPDGRFQAEATGGLIRVWMRPLKGLERFRMPIGDPSLVSFSTIHPGTIVGSSLVIFSPDGRHVLLTGARGRLCECTSTRVYDVATGQPASPPLRPGGVILSAAFTPDGRNLVLASSQRAVESSGTQRWGEARVTRWDWQSGRMIGPPTVISDDPWEVCCSPDGKQIAVITALSRLVLIESASGKVLREGETGLKPGTVAVWGKMGARVCFSPEGKVLTRLGSEDWDFSRDGRWTIKGTAICDAHTEKQIADLPSHPDAVLASRFSPDGTRVLTGCRDGAGRLWDWRTGRLVCPPLRHAREMFDVGFTPDGNFLATVSTDGTARVWEGLTGRPVTPPLRLGAMAWTLEISPDGRSLAVGGVSPRHPGIPVFDLQDLSPDPRVKPDELQSWSELVARQRIHETGNIENLASAEWLARWKACRHLRTEQPSIDWSPQSQADWHDRQALAFESAGDRQAEIWHLDRLVERQPRNPQILRRRGQAYGKVGQLGKAITDLSTAIDLDPADESAWSSRGQVELDSGQVDAAIADFNKALELAPEHWQALANRGIARGRKAATATAVDDLSQALRIAPGETRFLKERARLYQALGFAKKALADFEQIVEIDPAEPTAHNDLAWFLGTALDASIRDPQRAVESARRAIQLGPGAGGYWNTLGVAQYRRGDWMAAIEALTKSTELSNGGDKNDWFFLAMAHWRLGDKSAARSWYDKAVRWTNKNGPKDAELSRIRGEAAALLEATEKSH